MFLLFFHLNAGAGNYLGPYSNDHAEPAAAAAGESQAQHGCKQNLEIPVQYLFPCYVPFHCPLLVTVHVKLASDFCGTGI